MAKRATTKYLKLPFHFDEDQLVKELAVITDVEWAPHHYTMSHDGGWKVLALYTKEGEEKDTFAASDASTTLKSIPVLQQCPYLQQVIQHFKCPLISVRLLRLNVGSVIKPHQDYKLGYEDDNFRLHIPIATNEQVRFMLDGELLKMRPGECWYTNVNYTHSVSNQGPTDRIHLVIDGERNQWSDQLFFSLAPRESFNLNDSHDSPEVIQRMIEELQGAELPGAIQLLAELERKLEQLRSKAEE